MAAPSHKLISQDALEVACLDFEYFARYFLVIKTKEARLEPLVLNEAQTYVHELLGIQYRNTGKVRALVLKARQKGISTYVEARYFWKTWKGKGINAFILTHEDKATANLFGMVERYYKHLPPGAAPLTEKASANELAYAGKDCRYGVGTARTKGTGRSQTTHLFHWSEVAHSANQAEHAAGILQTIPDVPGTESILETTANGVGELFHVRWEKAAEVLDTVYEGDLERMAAEYDGYLPIFLPWYWMQDYRRGAEGFERTDEEQALADRFGLDDEQLAWRRWKIDDLAADTRARHGPENLFRQEYPATPTEAFLFSGGTFFPPEALEAQEANVREPIARGVLEIKPGGKIHFVPQSNGWLEVFEWPDEDEDYVCGLDVSEGLPHGDLNSGHILKRGLLPEQVARFAPVMDPKKLAEYTVLACQWYGLTPLAIERNNMGITTVLEVEEMEYEHQFRMPMAEASDKDRPSHKIGWITGAQSRAVLCGDLLGAVRDGTLLVRSKETLRQMRTFVRNANGKPEAAPGCKDDDVVGIGIALQMTIRTEPVLVEAVTKWNRGPVFHAGWQG